MNFLFALSAEQNAPPDLYETYIRFKFASQINDSDVST